MEIKIIPLGGFAFLITAICCHRSQKYCKLALKKNIFSKNITRVIDIPEFNLNPVLYL